MNKNQLKEIYEKNKINREKQVKADLEKCIENTIEEIKNDINSDKLNEHALSFPYYVKNFPVGEDCIRRTVERLESYHGVDLYWTRISSEVPYIEHGIIYDWSGCKKDLRYLASIYGNRYRWNME